METKYTKWAIYRGKIGLYALMLIENAEDAEDKMFYPVIKKDPGRLPVVVNRAGGMARFDPFAEEYIETRILPEDASPLRLEEQFPVNSLDFCCGFVSPDGLTVSCVKGAYSACAEEICKHLLGVERYYMAEHYLTEERGWISVFEMDDELNIAYEGSLSRKQVEAIKKVGLQRFHPNIHVVLRQAEKSWEDDGVK